MLPLIAFIHKMLPLIAFIHKMLPLIVFIIFGVGFLYLVFAGGCLLGAIITLSFLCSFLFHTPPNRVYQEISKDDPAAKEYMLSGAEVLSPFRKHLSNDFTQWILSNKTMLAHTT